MTTDYLTIKNSTIQVLAFAKEYVQEQKIDLRTSIAEDLSLWEWDGYEFLNKFQKRFNLTLPQKAYDYVCPADLKMNTIRKILYVPTFLLTMPFFLIAYPLLTNERRESIRKKIKRNKHRLTIGDLAATLAIGEFVKREDIKIRLNQ